MRKQETNGIDCVEDGCLVFLLLYIGFAKESNGRAPSDYTSLAGPPNIQVRERLMAVSYPVGTAVGDLGDAVRAVRLGDAVQLRLLGRRRVLNVLKMLLQ